VAQPAELAGQATVTDAKADDTVTTVITKSGRQIASGVAAG
jgi:hypothetical protein